ncbi:tyrosine-type recombinase/integrase [Nocardia pseudovaccinii]|uniref:tyrosine-type recombinase/integrase n=1 Tax=Nocardia pseudovaccinii TaxID=189540 RepID=UPI003D949723
MSGHGRSDQRRKRHQRAREALGPTRCRSRRSSTCGFVVVRHCAIRADRRWIHAKVPRSQPSVETELVALNVNRMFPRLREKAGVPQVRVQDLRHSCATLLFTMGVEAATVQKILRHSSITVMTDIYMEVIEAVKRDVPDS